MTLVFGADGRIVEPADLFTANMPKSLAFHPIRDDVRCNVSGDKVIHKMRIRPGAAAAEPVEQTAIRKLAPGEKPARKALGHNNIGGCLKDMIKEGLDAEIVFPSVARWIWGGLLDDNLAPTKGFLQPTIPEELKAWRDIWSGGHGVGLIDDIPSVAQLVERLEAEYRAGGTPAVDASAERAD